jgi:hypothetical protein
MKTLLTIILFLTGLGLTAGKRPIPKSPELVLQFEITHDIQLTSVDKLRFDRDITNVFTITSLRSNENVTKILHSQTGICLGMFWGIPSKEFILYIWETELHPKNVNYIVRKMKSRRK